jgi:hypothetical protein
MKLVTLKCPSCFASVELENGQDTTECNYCHSRVVAFREEQPELISEDFVLIPNPDKKYTPRACSDTPMGFAKAPEASAEQCAQEKEEARRRLNEARRPTPPAPPPVTPTGAKGALHATSSFFSDLADLADFLNGDAYGRW